MKIEAEEDEIWDKEVAGEYVTFKVYLYLLRTKEASLRDVFRGVSLSSVSLALHHLKKLEDLHLVEHNANGCYRAVPRRFGILRFFYRIRGILLPRSFFYMLFYLGIAAISFLTFPSIMREVALVFAFIGAGINLVETLLFLRLIH